MVLALCIPIQERMDVSIGLIDGKSTLQRDYRGSMRFTSGEVIFRWMYFRFALATVGHLHFFEIM